MNPNPQYCQSYGSDVSSYGDDAEENDEDDLSDDDDDGEHDDLHDASASYAVFRPTTYLSSLSDSNFFNDSSLASEAQSSLQSSAQLSIATFMTASSYTNTGNQVGGHTIKLILTSILLLMLTHGT